MQLFSAFATVCASGDPFAMHASTHVLVQLGSEVQVKICEHVRPFDAAPPSPAFAPPPLDPFEDVVPPDEQPARRETDTATSTRESWPMFMMKNMGARNDSPMTGARRVRHPNGRRAEKAGKYAEN